MYLVDASLKCNFEDRSGGPCKYCYNTSARRQSIKNREKIDLDAIEATLRREYAKCQKTIALHGGEPLSWGNKVLERLLRISYELSGRSSLQSNGSLIDDKKIALFKKYKTSVGVSIDGFWPANKWRGGTKAMTDLVIKNILKLKKAEFQPGLIIVLHKDNANEKNIKYVENFIIAMSKQGISGKINPITHPDSKIELTPKEAKWAYLRLANFILDNNLKGWDPFTNIVNNLLGYPLADCVFANCDPYCTESASIIINDGTLTVCKKFKTEILLRSSEPIYTRWEILQQTDCKDCRYAGKICFGGCPATSKDWDWRNKTRWCEPFKALFEFFENRLKTLSFKIPLKTDENFKGICSDKIGDNTGHGDAAHGDHSEHKDNLKPKPEHEDAAPHGDAAHGDAAHGDHSEHKDNLKPKPEHGDAARGDHSERKDSLSNKKSKK